MNIKRVYNSLNRVSQLLAILVVSVVMISCGIESRVKVLKLGHGLDKSHSVHKAMLFMGEKLKEKSGGKMEIQIYPSSQLGGEKQCLELLQIGSLAITKVSAAALENFAPKYQVLGLPYLFDSREHSFSILDGPIGEELLNDGEKYWLKGLCFYDAGCRSFYTKENPINKPEDLEGLKIRVMKSNTAVNMVKAMGGSPTPISFAELYTALQSGVVDGAENNPPSYHLSRHYEVCKYYSIDEHTMVPDVLVVSSHIWKQLSDEEKGWLKEAARESVPVQRKLWMEAEQESLKAVKEMGAIITYPDKSPFSAKTESIFDDYKDNKVIYSLIKRVQAESKPIK